MCLIYHVTEAPPFDISEIHKYLKKVDGWDVKITKKKFLFNQKI